MGSRGTSSGRKGSSGVTITQFQDGNTIIDLSESPLTYGGTDKALTGKARETIENFENKRYKNKVEFSTFVTDDGTIIEENRGGKGSVTASDYARAKADVMSHNHPRPEGVIGGTLSTGDIDNFVNHNQHTYRATTKEGTYSISRGKNFDGKGLSAAYKKAASEFERDGNNFAKSLKAKMRSGELTYSEAKKQAYIAQNKNLVSYHNWLLDNQKKYGYTYTLEKR